MTDPLAALTDHLDPPEPGSRACVIEVLCDDAAAIVVEVRAFRALEERLRRYVGLTGHGFWARDLLAALDDDRSDPTPPALVHRRVDLAPRRDADAAEGAGGS